MGKNKFGQFVLVGAITGGLVSMLDRSTREQVAKQLKDGMSKTRYYSRNPEILKSRAMDKKEQIQTIVEQFTEDATYIKGKVDELRLLTPQVKELVVETKEAFVEAKDDYSTLVNKNQ
ncbi:YtxH domain-containing protein [Sporosarcina sp. CAU 1771]